MGRNFRTSEIRLDNCFNIAFTLKSMKLKLNATCPWNPTTSTSKSRSQTAEPKPSIPNPQTQHVKI